MAAKVMKKRRKGRNGIYIFITVLLTLVAGSGGIGLFFKVSKIEVAGGEVYSDEEIIEMAEVRQGDNLLLIKENVISDRIKSKLIYIDQVTVVRSYPDKVILEIVEDAPIATASADGTTWFVNTAGKLFEMENAGDGNDLIQIVGAGISEPENGKIAMPSGGDTHLECITEFLKAVRRNDIEDKISYVNVSNIGSITFDFDGRFEGNLGAKGEIGNKMDMLVSAINKIEPDARGRLEFTTEIELHFVPEN